jgi:hypothetical protein
MKAWNTPEIVRIETGATDRLGQCRVGVVSVYDLPISDPRAPAVRVARLVLCGVEAGIAWESTMDVRESDVVPVGDGLCRVLAIVFRGPPDRPEVTFAPTPGNPLDPNSPTGTSIILAETGLLRIAGPEIENAWDLHVTGWEPDSCAPRRVSLEWWPALFSRSDSDPKSIEHAVAEPGTDVVIGRHRLNVRSLYGRVADRSAWAAVSIAADGRATSP